MNIDAVIKKLLADPASQASKLTGGLGEMLEVIESILDPMVMVEKFLEKLAGEVLKELTETLTMFTDVIDDIISVAVKPFMMALQMILTPIKMVAMFLAAVVEPFKELFALLSRLVAVPLKMFGKLLEMLSAPIKYLLKALEQFVKAVENITDVIGLGVKTQQTIVDQARSALQGAWDDVINLMKDPISNLLPLMGKLRQYMEAIDPYVVEAFDMAVRDLTALFGSILRPVFEAATRVVREFANQLAPVMDRIRPLVETLANEIGDFLVGMIPTFMAMLNDLIPLAKQYIETLKDEIKFTAWRMRVWNQFTESIKRLVNPFGSVVDDAKKAEREAKGEVGKDGIERKDVTGLATAVNPRQVGFQSYGQEIGQRAFVAAGYKTTTERRAQQDEFYALGVAWLRRFGNENPSREAAERMGAAIKENYDSQSLAGQAAGFIARNLMGIPVPG